MLKKLLLLLLLLFALPHLANAQALDQAYVNYYNPLLSGATCTSTTLQSAITAIGSKVSTIYLTGTDRNKAVCNWSITTDVTVPPHINLWVPYGATATINSGITLTIAGCLQADDPAWYTGSGTLLNQSHCGFAASTSLGGVTGSFVVQGCLHGTSGTSTVTVTPCTANLNTLSGTTPVMVRRDVPETQVTFSGGDNTYYLALRDSDTATAAAGWTCTGAYCFIAAATDPPLPLGSLFLTRSVVSAGAVISVVDLRRRHMTYSETITTNQSTGPQAVWSWDSPGAIISLAPGVKLTLGACPLAGRWQIFNANDITSGLVSFGTPCNILPEWYGAKGDGVTLDGLALYGMVGGINASLPVGLPLTVTFAPGRTYLITGHNFGIPPVHREGIRFFTKSDVEIVAFHAEMKVPSTYPYTNTDANPTITEAGGLEFRGARCKVRGGVWNGNLTQRVVTSGPANGPHDGAEVGLRLGKDAADALVEQATFKEWGTENMYISVGTEGALVRNSVFDRPRRNNVGIVVIDPDSVGTPDKPLIFEGNEFRNAAQYPLSVQRRPGSGVHIEGSGAANIKVSVHLINNIFTNNRNENIGLQGSGYRHVIKNNLLRSTSTAGGDGLPTFPGGIVMGPNDLGGHVIQGNVFDDYGITATFDDPAPPDDEPVVIIGNVFRGSQPPVETVPYGPEPTWAPPQGWVFASNSVSNVSKNAETYLKGLTHKVGYNTYSNPPQYTSNTSVAIGATATLDLQPLLAGTATYLVIAKGNAGAGAFAPIGIYIMVWNDSTLEASWNMIPPNGFFQAKQVEPGTPPPPPYFSQIVDDDDVIPPTVSGVDNTKHVVYTQMTGDCPGGTRTITRSGTVLTFDNTTCQTTSFFGIIAYQIGRGDWGT